eukprot:CAMPEP_0185728320 /NCGR_PEP_ID=MMETSP1171-20130828/3703_1 /TAXON_ID=374046 /ORGANISM="Helicotheca tamensis, Strain CCMP826" /LENGTH=227 /DNA_ID=CAMNT_0028397013 /DNA_START=131 /DNA_END=814 /DNA_ORIENTATION=+
MTCLAFISEISIFLLSISMVLAQYQCAFTTVSTPKSRCHPFLRPLFVDELQQKKYPPVTSLKGGKDDDDENILDGIANPEAVSSNVLGTPLLSCCANVRGTGIGTGFYRNGFCSTGEQDLGRHTVCVQVTEKFLEYSKSVGNDLSTPVPEFMFPGLQEGDIWCLCAQRWAQAYNAGKAPRVFLQASHEKTLDYVPFEVLREFAIDSDEADQALDDLNEQRKKLNKLL